jgi:hypothetical protein
MSWGSIPIAPQVAVQTAQSAVGGINLATSTPIPMISAAVAHTKGAWQELFASTAFNATLIELIPQGTGSSAQNRHMLCDIGIGAPGSEAVLVPNISIGMASSWRRFTIPIWVPQGSRVSVRYQTAPLSLSMNVQLVLHATGHAQADTGSSATAYGANLAASSGTPLTLPGAIHTAGAWTQITASTTGAARALVVMPEGPAGASWSQPADALIDIGYGGVGTEQPLLSGLAMTWAVTETTEGSPITLPISLPSGTRLVARYQASTIVQPPLMTILAIS